MDFVIMIAIHKVTDGTRFMKDMFKAPDAGGEDEFTKVAVYILNMANNRMADD